jgi:EmrB/QacA subfamily drug resistance transporter
MHHRPKAHDMQDGHRESTRRPWTVLALLAVAQFMVVLDITVVNVALPSIGADLGFAADQLQWAVIAYVLFTGGLLLLGGRLSDLVGRRPIFLTGLLLFTIASLASGLASGPGMLIVSRAFQGIGAAMLSPAALSIITTTYTGEQRTTALSAWGAIGAGGAGAGVLFGGMLVTWLSWKWVFFINVPIGVVTAVLATHLLPKSEAERGSLRRLDLPGSFAVVAGLISLVLAIEGTGSHGWTSIRTLALFGLAAGLLATFIRIERNAAHPLVPSATWARRSLVTSTALMLGTSGILVGGFFLNSLFLQGVLDASPLETGLAFLPLVVMIGVAAHLAPHLLAQFGARAVVVAGLVLAATGNLLLSGAPGSPSYAVDLLPGFLLIGLGVGLAFVSVSVTAMADIPDHEAGLASGLMTTAHEIGAAFGVALLSVVALGSSAAGSAIASGYGDGALAAAGIAAALALTAVVSVPALKPSSGQRLAMH